MWVKRSTYELLLTENARLSEKVTMLERLRSAKDDELARALADTAAVYDDLRKLLGLKPRVEQQVVAGNMGTDALGFPAPGNHQFKMKDTPRDALMRAQREHDAQALKEDQAGILAAIKEFEGVLR